MTIAQWYGRDVISRDAMTDDDCADVMRTPGLLLSNQPAREFDMEYIMAHLRSGKRQKILYIFIDDRWRCAQWTCEDG